MLYNKLIFEQTDSGIIFGNDRFELRFAKNGELASIEIDGTTYRSGAEELRFTLDGEYRSTIDLVNINKNWASLRLENSRLEKFESEYVGHKLVKTNDSVELRLTVRLGQFEVTKIYRVKSGRCGFTRRVEVTNCGQNVKLRMIALTFPTLSGFRTTSRPAQPILLTDGTRTFAAWTDPREESRRFDNALTCVIQTQNTLDTGESLTTGELDYELFDCDPIAAAKLVSDRLEKIGLRCHREKGSMLRSLVCYEVEIGPLRLSETKCHHRYDHPDELAADLERIKSLGFNVAELMPSFLFPCYTVYDLRNPDIQHGAGESIRPIIRRAHEIGMKVIIDVLMHGCIDTEIADYDREHYSSRRYYWPEWQKKIPELAGADRARVNPLREEHPDWFIYERPGEIFKGYTWTFDHANEGFQNYFAEAMEISVLDWGVDGFRFDAPTWQSGTNSAENLPYSAGESINHGHCELFRKVRQRVDSVRDDIIFIVEGPYYEYTDSCDMAYSYDLHYQMKNIFEGKMNASQIQHYCEARQAIFPDGALWLNFADNHDTWNNGVTEDGLYSYERYGIDAAKAMFAFDCFVGGGVQAFGGSEDNPEFAEFMSKMLKLRENLSDIMYNCDTDYSIYPSDERLFCVARWSSELSEMLWFVVNLSPDEVECKLEEVGTAKFRPFEAKLWRNEAEIAL